MPLGLLPLRGGGWRWGDFSPIMSVKHLIHCRFAHRSTPSLLLGLMDSTDFKNLTRFGFLKIRNQKLFLLFKGEIFSVPSTFLLGKQSAFSLFEILRLDSFYRRLVIAGHIGDSP